MSQGFRMKIFTHINTDTEEAQNVSGNIAAGLDGFIKSVYGEKADGSSWTFFAQKSENGCDETEAEFYEVISGSPLQKIDDLLMKIDTLNNGSYGILLADSDYGVICYRTFGDAEFSDISEKEAAGYSWGTDSALVIEKSFRKDLIADLLNISDTDELCDAIEERYEEITEQLVPEIIKEIYPDGDLFESCTADDENDNMIVRFVFASYNHTTEQLSAWKDAFEKGSLDRWTLHLTDAECKDGNYNNVMINVAENAVTVFITSSGSISDIRFLAVR